MCFAFHKSNLYTPNMTKGFWEVDHFFLFTHGSKMRHIWGSPYVLFFLSPWPHHLQQDGPVSRVVRLQSAFFCALIQFLSLYNCGLCSLSNYQTINATRRTKIKLTTYICNQSIDRQIEASTWSCSNTCRIRKRPVPFSFSKLLISRCSCIWVYPFYC